MGHSNLLIMIVSTTDNLSSFIEVSGDFLSLKVLKFT